jgi:signal transduction histidine kinase
VEIVDDGRGIAPGTPAGVGTAAMRERAEELGGTLEVVPAVPAGTRVIATVPLPEPDPEEE